MISLRCLPHDRLELRSDEAGGFDDLQRLPWVEAGVASAVQTRVGVELRIGPYVGRLVIPDRVTIDVEEPFPGTVAACLGLATTGRRAGGQMSPQGRVDVPPWSTIATGFERVLAHYVSRGIERRYLPRTIVTSRPRGRIDVTASAVRLASRGRTHQVVCSVRPLTDDTPFNQAVLAGAARAEQLLRRDRVPATLTSLRRSMMTLTGVRRDIAPDFRIVRSELDPHREDHQTLLSLAELLVSGVPALPRSEQHDARHPMSAWLNVERLFEEAVLTITRRSVASIGAMVHAGRGDGVHLFSRRSGDPQTIRKAADPDVVIRRGDDIWLLDAKYRRHRRDFSEEELYQLIAHAGAYRASAAALVAPLRAGDTLGYRWLGRDTRGTAYYIVTVDPTTQSGMESPIRSWLSNQIKPQPVAASEAE